MRIICSQATTGGRIFSINVISSFANTLSYFASSQQCHFLTMSLLVYLSVALDSSCGQGPFLYCCWHTLSTQQHAWHIAIQ